MGWQWNRPETRAISGPVPGKGRPEGAGRWSPEGEYPEGKYTFLARDTEAPYMDTRANLSPAPETRYYVAQFLRRDTLVGQLSGVLVVTVPGAA